MSDLFGAYVIQASHVFLRTQEPKVRSAALVTLGSCVRRSTVAVGERGSKRHPALSRPDQTVASTKVAGVGRGRPVLS